ncbi:membrane-attack complex/perforin family protein [Mucilaginibacter pedocola]|uniref:MACPF domain-containing protein n=1 Tax=Mucilaginibacter pedocola TaxID=1792845 RepID=A0A1S9PHA5_9SPHI|nr:hypothetical protein [Mucilaginibacter pedocola]OOQ60333.1 hypothetical protein BC343_25240 [Mucilaginibacter pedocola]
MIIVKKIILFGTLLFSTILVIALFSCRHAPSIKYIRGNPVNLKDSGIRGLQNYTTNGGGTTDKLAFGQGFNTLTGDFMSAVLIETPYITAFPYNGTQYGQKISLSFNLVESTTDFRNKLGIDFKASLKIGAFSGSSEYKAFNETAMSRLSTYLLISLKVTNPTLILNAQKYKLTHEAERLKDDTTQFKESFGNEFAYGMSTGGTMYILYEYNSSSSEDKRKTTQALSAKVKTLFSKAAIDLSIEHDLRNLETFKQTNVTIFGSGFKDTLPDLETSKLIQYIKDFPAKVKLNGGHPVITDITTNPIKTLSFISKRRMFDSFLEQSFALEEFALRIDSLRQFMNDANYVKTYSSFFDKSEQQGFDSIIKVTGNKLKQIDRDSRRCMNNLNSCNIDFSKYNAPTFDPTITAWFTQAAPRRINISSLSYQPLAIDTIRTVLKTYQLEGRYTFSDYWDPNQINMNNPKSNLPFEINASSPLPGQLRVATYCRLKFQVFDLESSALLEEIFYLDSPIKINRHNVVIKLVPVVTEGSKEASDLLTDARTRTLFKIGVDKANPLGVFIN